MVMMIEAVWVQQNSLKGSGGSKRSLFAAAIPLSSAYLIIPLHDYHFIRSIRRKEQLVLGAGKGLKWLALLSGWPRRASRKKWHRRRP